MKKRGTRKKNMKGRDIPKVRVYEWERKLVDEARDRMGMTLSDFIRYGLKLAVESAGLQWKPPTK